MNPYRSTPPRAPSRRSFFYRAVDALMIPGAFVATILVGASPACTPTARQQADAVVSTLGPVLCSTLAAVTGSNGATVGLVCADAAKAIGAGLMIASASRTNVVGVAAHAEGCTPLQLVSVAPERDAREYVCVEAFGGEGQARAAVLRALATGHAK